MHVEPSVRAARRPPLTRAEVAAILHALDPLELRSPIVRRIAADAFTTEDVLARLAWRLEREAPEIVVQLGCASAGIGLWLAEHMNVQLIAIDPVPFAVEHAMHACGGFRLDQFPTFANAPFDHTQLPTGGAQVVLSIGGLYLAPAPAAALAECNRVLVHGGLLAFDVFVADDDPTATGWVHALERAGFDLLDIDDQTAHWRAVTREQHLVRLQYESYLVERLGPRAAAAVVAQSRSALSVLASTRRVELLARRKRRRWPRGSSNGIATRIG